MVSENTVNDDFTSMLESHLTIDPGSSIQQFIAGLIFAPPTGLKASDPLSKHYSRNGVEFILPTLHYLEILSPRSEIELLTASFFSDIPSLYSGSTSMAVLGHLPLTSEQERRCAALLESMDRYMAMDYPGWERFRNGLTGASQGKEFASFIYPVEEEIRGHITSLNGNFAHYKAGFLYDLEEHYWSGDSQFHTPRDLAIWSMEHYSRGGLLRLLDLLRHSPQTEGMSMESQNNLNVLRSIFASLHPRGVELIEVLSRGMGERDAPDIGLSNFSLLSWEKMIELACLTEEYNLEWAIAAMEW